MGVVGYEGGAVEQTSGSVTYRRWYSSSTSGLIRQQTTATGAEIVRNDGGAEYGLNPILPAFPAADATSATGYATLPDGFTYTGDGYYKVRLTMTRGIVTGGGYWQDENPTPDNYRLHYDFALNVWRMRASTSPGVVHRQSPQTWHSTVDVDATRTMFGTDDFAHPCMTWVPSSGWTAVNDFSGTTYDAGFTVTLGSLAESTWNAAGGFLAYFDYSWPLALTLSVQAFAEVQHPSDLKYPPTPIDPEIVDPENPEDPVDGGHGGDDLPLGTGSADVQRVFDPARPRAAWTYQAPPIVRPGCLVRPLRVQARLTGTVTHTLEVDDAAQKTNVALTTSQASHFGPSASGERVDVTLAGTANSVVKTLSVDVAVRRAYGGR